MTPFSALDPIFGEQLLLAPREGEIVFFPRFRSRPLVLFAFGLVHTGQWEGCCVCRKGGASETETSFYCVIRNFLRTLYVDDSPLLVNCPVPFLNHLIGIRDAPLFPPARKT